MEVDDKATSYGSQGRRTARERRKEEANPNARDRPQTVTRDAYVWLARKLGREPHIPCPPHRTGWDERGIARTDRRNTPTTVGVGDKGKTRRRKTPLRAARGVLRRKLRSLPHHRRPAPNLRRTRKSPHHARCSLVRHARLSARGVQPRDDQGPGVVLRCAALQGHCHAVLSESLLARRRRHFAAAPQN